MKPCSHRNHVIFYNNAYLQKHVIPVTNTGVTGNMSVVYNMWASDPRWFTHHMPHLKQVPLGSQSQEYCLLIATYSYNNTYFTGIA